MDRPTIRDDARAELEQAGIEEAKYPVSALYRKVKGIPVGHPDFYPPPPDLPAAELRYLAGIVTRSESPDTTTVVHACTNVIAYANGQFQGDTPAGAPRAPAAPRPRATVPPTAQQRAAALEQAAEAGSAPAGTSAGLASAIPWGTILAIALELLQRYAK